jgi:hypothetical protein
VQDEPRRVEHGLEGVVVDDREVVAALAHAVGGLRGLRLLEGELHVGMRDTERRDGGRDEHGRGAGERGEPQAARAEVEVVVEVARRPVELLAQHRGVPGEDLAGGGRAHAARAALQQRRPGFLLQRRDGLRYRRLGVAQRARGRGHRALARHRVEDQHAPRVEHRQSLRALSPKHS